MKYLFFFFILLLPLYGTAQVLKVGHLFDSKNKVWLKNQIIVIRDNHISEMNPNVLPRDLKIIDYSDMWITPSFIDSHSHLFLNDLSHGKDFSAGLKKWVNRPKAEKINLARRRALSLKNAGFSMVRDLGNQGEMTTSDIQSIKDLNILSSGPGLVPLYGQLPPDARKELDIEYRKIDQGLKLHKETLVKIYADEEPNPTIANLLEVKRLTGDAQRLGKFVAIHAILVNGIDVAIKSNPNSLEHGTEITDSQLEVLSKSNTVFVPTLSGALILNPLRKKFHHDYAEKEFKTAVSNIKKSLSLGIKVAYGSDHYFEYNVRDYGHEQIEIISKLIDSGIDALDVLQMLTYHGSLAQNAYKVGVIEVGHKADLNVYSASPTVNPKELYKVKYLWRNGLKAN